MTALPMTLEDALHYQGFTIEPVDQSALAITVAAGTLVVPAMTISTLVWARAEAEKPGDDLYLGKLPIFDEDYRPVILSHILDRYRTRRLGYNTAGQWRLAFRRWGNLNMTVFNRRYESTAVNLPLDDRDETDSSQSNVEATTHGLDVGSDFPQSLISGNTDYASSATDSKTADNSEATGTIHRTGRSQSIMRLLAEQRDSYLNVDQELVAQMDDLFLSTFDQGEGEPLAQYGLPYRGMPYREW